MNKTNTLVALLKEPHDWQIVNSYGIYRIRGSIRFPPDILKNRCVEYLGFYLPAKFGKYKFSVRHYAKVRKVSMAPRYECIPDEPRNSKSDDDYYKFDLEEPIQLKEPIVSYRGRSHMVLIPTTAERLLDAKELNFLYMGSQLEETMWESLLEHNIFPEREYPVHTRDANAYLLDFAVFCRAGQFAIETDGSQHHESRSAVLKDNQRDNQLSIEKWEVLRYAAEDVAPSKINRTLSQITEKIEGLGGLKSYDGLFPAKPLIPASTQLGLFHEAHLDYLALRRRVLEKYERETT